MCITSGATSGSYRWCNEVIDDKLFSDTVHPKRVLYSGTFAKFHAVEFIAIKSRLTVSFFIYKKSSVVKNDVTWDLNITKICHLICFVEV